MAKEAECWACPAISRRRRGSFGPSPFPKAHLPVETAGEGVLQAFHILNQFDIPKGAARGHRTRQGSRRLHAWTIAADLKNLRYYFRTYDNSRIRMVDLKAVNLDAKEIKTISMKGDEQIEDVSARPGKPCADR